ncbi:hypothetical protein [Paenibacillus sp. Y412MC10]|uniref:hypothetical protein n=1 Tax=Geobacillus sp. (strain Y412MC10) TaxID=481743 RepID=UPI0011AB3870|nr:hypothetical protein [Paenibacillus sp. Y412MC10]
MGKQLSLCIDDGFFSITDKEISPNCAKQKEEERCSAPDPFVEANKAFFGIEEGEQLEFSFLTIPNLEEEESMSFKDIAKKLEECRKYTLMMIDDLTGFPVSIQLTVNKAVVEPYAQYPEALHLNYRAKRRRSDSTLVFLPNRSFIIWEGHINVDSNMWGNASRTASGVITRRAKYRPNDKRFLSEGVASTDMVPCVDYRPANAIA